jgi:CHAD domain-containing protein
MVKTFDALGLDGERDAASWRDALVAVQRETKRRALSGPERRAGLTAMLRRARRRASRFDAHRHGWKAIGPGLRRTYRRGRRAFAAARQDPTPERLHEWRKQTKYFWNVVRMLEPVWPARLQALGRRTHRLSNQLGEDHDLVLLRERAAKRPTLDTRTRDAALERIDRRRLALQKRAMALGAIVYKDRPRTLERRLHRRWRVWRST